LVVNPQVQNALERNVKSYGAWYHRKWVLSKKGHYYPSLENELQLLNDYQKQAHQKQDDEKQDDPSRNFHAWNYRR